MRLTNNDHSKVKNYLHLDGVELFNLGEALGLERSRMITWLTNIIKTVTEDNAIIPTTLGKALNTINQPHIAQETSEGIMIIATIRSSMFVLIQWASELTHK